jgi:hypothetical protein
MHPVAGRSNDQGAIETVAAIVAQEIEAASSVAPQAAKP